MADVAERLTCAQHALVQNGIGDDLTRPQTLEQCLLADHLAVCFGQREQEGKRLGFDLDGRGNAAPDRRQ
jgi:hypothetical protein